MIPIRDLEVHPLVSDMEVPMDALMEGELTEERLMSLLHQEVEETLEFYQVGGLSHEEYHRREALGGWEGPIDLLRIMEEMVEEEREELMTSVLDEQPLLRVAVSGQCCIQSAGALPLKKFHPYCPSAYFLGNLCRLPATESF